MCDSPLITATILKKRTEVIDVRDIGPIVTIHANGTRFVDNRNGGKPNAAPAGQTIKVLRLKIIDKKADGSAYVVNRLYANKTLITQIQNGPTVTIYPNETRFVCYQGNDIVQNERKKEPWSVSNLILLSDFLVCEFKN